MIKVLRAKVKKEADLYNLPLLNYIDLVRQFRRFVKLVKRIIG